MSTGYRPHCDKGHPLEGRNLYVDPKGYAYCRKCRREADHHRRSQQKDAMCSDGVERAARHMELQLELEIALPYKREAIRQKMREVWA